MSKFKIRGFRIYPVGPGRQRKIGELDWSFDGWVGRSDHPLTDKWGGVTTVPQPTERLAAETVAKRFQIVKRMVASWEEREHAWATLDRAAMKGKVEAEARRIVRKCRKDLGHLSRGRLDLGIRFRKANYTSGHASGSYTVRITISPLTPWWEIQWLLTHELAHCVRGTSPRGSGRKRIVHGPKWQEAFCRIAERAHDIDCWAECGSTVVWSRRRGVDKLLADALKLED